MEPRLIMPLRGPKLILGALIKALTSKDGGHDHGVDLPAEAGTYVTKKARSPGISKAHVHVFVVKPGASPGDRILSSPGVDGHRHHGVLGSLAKALDIGTTRPPEGNDAVRRESVEGQPKDKKRDGKKNLKLKKNKKRGY